LHAVPAVEAAWRARRKLGGEKNGRAGAANAWPEKQQPNGMNAGLRRGLSREALETGGSVESAFTGREAGVNPCGSL